MAALEPQYIAILKNGAGRAIRAVPATAAWQSQCGRSGRQTTLASLQSLCPAQAPRHHSVGAAGSSLDDFQDKGIGIQYHRPSETLYLLQTKLKESEQFKQEDALPFCEGVRLLRKRLQREQEQCRGVLGRFVDGNTLRSGRRSSDCPIAQYSDCSGRISAQALARLPVGPRATTMRVPL